jgi:hypothetical protein
VEDVIELQREEGSAETQVFHELFLRALDDYINMVYPPPCSSQLDSPLHFFRPIFLNIPTAAACSNDLTDILVQSSSFLNRKIKRHRYANVTLMRELDLSQLETKEKKSSMLLNERL